MEWNWNKTSITLPYSYENLKSLLDTVCKQENQFPQVDFCMWCDNLTTAWLDEDLSGQDEEAIMWPKALNVNGICIGTNFIPMNN
ncbi:hypothetical protein [Planococcus faecalis]|uniref:hypothetical protein n=1 Tax=Planococcus faecalis TaxID=1598147 RepID=UPI0008D9F85F|nr:hypothetical protein [Planococcus faecalis]OHX53172.1 hypothetical protein BB777_10965 [Planococcus faecalis]